MPNDSSIMRITRLLLSGARSARLNRRGYTIGRENVKVLTIALASLEKYLRENPNKDKEIVLGPIGLIPEDLYNPEEDSFRIISPGDLAENGGPLTFEMPPQLVGYSPWIVNSINDAPDIPNSTIVQYVLKNSVWDPPIISTAEKRSLRWGQRGTGSDILFYCFRV